MTAEGIAAIIIALATLVTAITALIVSLKNKGTIEQVQRQTDGMVEQLQAASMQEGLKKGRQGG